MCKEGSQREHWSRSAFLRELMKIMYAVVHSTAFSFEFALFWWTRSRSEREWVCFYEVLSNGERMLLKRTRRRLDETDSSLQDYMRVFITSSTTKHSRISLLPAHCKPWSSRFVCLAEDIIGEDNVVQLVSEIVDNCRVNSIPIIQCFKRNKLARIFKRGQRMSCMVVLKSAQTNNTQWRELQPYLDGLEVPAILVEEDE